MRMISRTQAKVSSAVWLALYLYLSLSFYLCSLSLLTLNFGPSPLKWRLANEISNDNLKKTNILKIHMLIACQVRWMPDGTTLSDQGGGWGDYWNMKWYWVTDKQIKQSSKQRLEMVRVEKRWGDQSSRKSQRCEERGLCVDCVCVCGLCPLHAPLVVYKGNCTRFNCNICWIKKERER